MGSNSAQFTPNPITFTGESQTLVQNFNITATALGRDTITYTITGITATLNPNAIVVIPYDAPILVLPETVTAGTPVNGQLVIQYPIPTLSVTVTLSPDPSSTAPVTITPSSFTLTAGISSYPFTLLATASGLVNLRQILSGTDSVSFIGPPYTELTVL